MFTIRTADPLRSGIFEERQVRLTVVPSPWSTAFDRTFREDPGWTTSGDVTFLQTFGARLRSTRTTAAVLSTPVEYASGGEMSFRYQINHGGLRVRLIAGSTSIEVSISRGLLVMRGPPGNNGLGGGVVGPSGRIAFVRNGRRVELHVLPDDGAPADGQPLGVTNSFGTEDATLEWSVQPEDITIREAFVSGLRFRPAVFIGDRVAKERTRFGEALRVRAPVVASSDAGLYPMVLGAAAGTSDIGTFEYQLLNSKVLGYGGRRSTARTFQFEHVADD